MDNKVWINILGITALFIVMLANYVQPNTVTDAALTATLDFDASLTNYIDRVLTTPGYSLFISIIVILAHLYIYIYLILLFQYYVFPSKGIVINFIIVFFVIMLLHVIKFTFFDNNPFTFAAMKSLLPYSGIWHLLTNFGAITGETGIGTIIEENITNQTNVTDINLDLR